MCAREMVTCMLSFSHATARVSRGARGAGHSVTGSVAVATEVVASSVKEWDKYNPWNVNCVLFRYYG